MIRERGGGNIQVKIINEEIDEVNQKIATLRAKVNDEKTKFNQ